MRKEVFTYLRPRRLAAAIALTALSLMGSLFATGRGPHTLADARLAAASQFVTASGTQLFLNGSPWAFTGYDSYSLVSNSPGFQCGGVYSDQQLDQLFSEMVQSSGTVAVRTWFFQSFGGPSNFSQYDRVLNAAAAYGIKIIPTLVNEWLDCEPDPTGSHYRNLAWYQGGYKTAGDGYPVSFRDFAQAMAAHYANNPTIAFWQIENETEASAYRNGPCDNTAAAQALRAYADDITGVIKSVDHNHLVNLGTIGGGQCGLQGSSYQYVYGGAVDICEMHDYSFQVVMGNQWWGTVPDVQACKALNKPIFAGEVGIDASITPQWTVSGVVTPQTLATRATFFQEKIASLFGMGYVGFMIWSKGLGASYTWNVGAGDPTEAVMLAEQQSLDTSQLVDGMIVTDGDPSPPGHSAGAAAVAGDRLQATAQAPTATASGSARKTPVHLDAPGAAAGPHAALSGWLLDRCR